MASPGEKRWPLSYRCSVSHGDGGGDDNVNDHDGAGGDDNDDDDGSVDDVSNDDDFPGPVPRGKVPVDVQSLEYDGSSFKGILLSLIHI